MRIRVFALFITQDNFENEWDGICASTLMCQRMLGVLLLPERSGTVMELWTPSPAQGHLIEEGPSSWNTAHSRLTKPCDWAWGSVIPGEGAHFPNLHICTKWASNGVCECAKYTRKLLEPFQHWTLLWAVRSWVSTGFSYIPHKPLTSVIS